MLEASKSEMRFKRKVWIAQQANFENSRLMVEFPDYSGLFKFPALSLISRFYQSIAFATLLRLKIGPTQLKRLK